MTTDLRLVGVHPTLIEKIERVLAAMAILGYPMKVTQGVRTVAQQQALYAQGRTKPGKVVTNCDGVRTRSNHQPHADGLGHAVDCAAAGPDPYPSDFPWPLYGAAVRAVGLIWGGSWTRFQDRPHAELP